MLGEPEQSRVAALCLLPERCSSLLRILELSQEIIIVITIQKIGKFIRMYICLGSLKIF